MYVYIYIFNKKVTLTYHTMWRSVGLDILLHIFTTQETVDACTESAEKLSVSIKRAEELVRSSSWFGGGNFGRKKTTRVFSGRNSWEPKALFIGGVALGGVP